MRNQYRKLVIGMLSMLMLFSTFPVQASSVENGTVYPITTNSIKGWPQSMDIYSETAVLMDADTGVILFDKGMNEKRYPASITKVMTALIALENADLDEQVIFTEICLADQVSGSGNIGMQIGEILTMRQCLQALLIQSANDVATQIAEYVGGSVSFFAEMMNRKAQELGCVNTHFVNASGMPDENHYTTAYDMALIFREAIKNITFREIIAAQSFTIAPTNMNSESRTYTIHHPLAAQSAPEYYEGCFGGKTGVTDSSKNTLVSGATKNGMTLIAVAMRAQSGEVCQDHINLFNYGFENFQKLEVPGGSITIPVGKDVSELEVIEEESGEETVQKYFYEGVYLLGSGIKELITPEVPILEPEITEIEQSEQYDKQEISKPEQGKAEENMKKIYQCVIFILAGMIVGVLIIVIISALKKKKNH